MLSQHLCSKRMKSPNHRAVSEAWHELVYALSHFVSGFYGERECQNPKISIAGRVEYPCNARGQDGCLSDAGSGKHQTGPLSPFGCLALSGAKLFDGGLQVRRSEEHTSELQS